MKLPSDDEICRRIDAVDDKYLRMMFRYQKLILGRISEVAGQYSPHRDDAFFDEDEHGNEYVMFAVKTANRKGRLRPVMRPLNPTYDPWAREVAEYFISQTETYPWRLHENPEASKKYAMDYARDMLDGLMWPMIDYTRSIRMPYDGDMVKAARYNDKGVKEYLVELGDGSRAWTTDTEEVAISFKVNQRWRKATGHVLYMRERMKLMTDYKFSIIDLAIIEGETIRGRLPASLRFFVHQDIQKAEGNLLMLKDLGMRYYPKLLIPHASLA